MAQTELLLPQWQSLDDARRQFIFQQLSRYFLTPLLHVDQMVPAAVNYFGNVLKTFDVLIGGEWLRFVPGQKAALLGVKRPFDAEIKALLADLNVSPEFAQAHLSAARTAAIPPMLVARSSVASDEEILGTIDITTHVFSGNHFAYVPLKPAVISLLTQTPKDVDPAATPDWPAILSQGDVVLHRFGEHQYQVAQKHAWQKPDLERALSGFGYTLPTSDQYEYLMGGGQPGLFAWGNQLPKNLAAYLPNRFGLTVFSKRRAPELVQEALSKSAPAAKKTAAKNLLALSPFYQTEETPFASSTYRKVAVISLDE